ncbi:MAG: helix-turn-helix domain-containing protein [Erysipelotrichaceae bacterium]|nr:helix-turn-helix domain-containing protein [Erysipelotrichaceae bacterium]
MKEIGLKLKLKREENGVSIEEAADDLKIRASQLESIEAGNQDDFKDVFTLKYFIRDYAKYLGLDGEEMLDDFNEYLFEQTSKISLEDIEEARREKEEREKNMKILSPYTITQKDKKRIYILIGIILLIALIGIISYIAISNQNKNDFVNSKISYKIGE